MKLEITDHMLVFDLARIMAKDVAAAVTRQRLRLVGSCTGPEYPDASLSRWKDTLRSMDYWDRRSFLSSVRYLFQIHRTESGSEIRGRDYVAKVRAYEASLAA